jgi:hypothetical protein
MQPECMLIILENVTQLMRLLFFLSSTNMQQIALTSKLVLAIVGLTSASAILAPTYAVPAITSADIVDGTIRSVDIKNGEVKNSDLGDDAVTTAKIADGTIQEQDIADGVIPTGDT